MIRKALLNKGKMLNATICGSSMEPTIESGDMVSIVKNSRCHVGDIVLYEYEKKTLVHRVLKIRKGYAYCKGDNSFRLEIVRIEDLMGKVLSVNGHTLKRMSHRLVYLSYRIACDYEKEKSILKTVATKHYRHYKKVMLKRFSRLN